MSAIASGQRVVCLGVHIVDVLGRPVSHIPPGQGRQILEEIRITAAGTAAGTAVDLAKLGVDVVVMGAVGDDLLADFLTSALQQHGIDTSHLRRKAGIQTSATMLPIRSNGERPALHCPGATSRLELADIDWDALAAADLLHVGGPDALGPFGGKPLRQVLGFARDHGVITTADVLTPGDTPTWRWLRPALELVQYFLPNDDQLRNLTGKADLTTAADMILDVGVDAVLVSTGAAGAALFSAGQRVALPAFNVPVVDTTGCGDAASAGFIAGLLRHGDLEISAWLGMAAAALVVQGLGSDAGIVDLDGTVALLVDHAPAALTERVRSLQRYSG